MEITDSKNLNPITQLRKFCAYFSSSNTIMKCILIISFSVFFPIIIALYVTFMLSTEIGKLITINKRKQKERKKLIEREKLRKQEERKHKEKEELIKEQERKDKKREELIKEQEREQERKKQEYNSKKFESEIVRLIKDHTIIIDTNLWMDYEYENFFGGLLNILNRYDYILNLCGAQFDEICNIRKKPKDDEQGLKANKAIKRIEKYQVEKVLTINSISCHEKKDAYADPAILEYLISEYPKNGGIALITKDKGLRVRARQIFENNGCSNYRVFDGNGLNNLAESFCLINNIESLF